MAGGRGRPLRDTGGVGLKKFMLGKKVGMTQVFDETGIAIPVTVVQAGPCTVIQKKAVGTDGYAALKVGYLEVPERKVTKPELGAFKKAGSAPLKHLREFKVSNVDDYEVGQAIGVADMFEAGDMVDVSGVSKGKGFAGVIKRYGQHRGKVTHGSKFHRGIGSMSANSFPGRIFKGKGMPGHMGAEKVTVQNLAVVKVDGEHGLMLIKGAAPGAKGALLVIKETTKSA
jgi:large subunit ribosomal protein L3